MSDKMKIYCISHTGKSIEADIFKYIADAALQMFFKERKSFKTHFDEIALHLKTKFETAHIFGISGTLFEVTVITPKGMTHAMMIGQVPDFESILDDNFEVVNIKREKVDVQREDEMKEEPKKNKKSNIPTPSLN